MKQIYQIREMMIVFYKKHEKIIFPIIRLIAGLMIFTILNRGLGYAKDLTKIPFILLMGLLTVLVPSQWLFLLLILVVTTHLFLVSPQVAALMFLVMLAIYLLYIRLFPQESLLILGVLLGYYFRIPYIVPLFGGLFVGIPAIVPIGIGTLIWSFIPSIPTLVQIQTEDILNLPDVLTQIYISMIQGLTGDQTWMISAIIFAAVVMIVHFLGKMEIDYAWYLAVGVGAVINVIGFTIAAIMNVIHINPLGLIISSIVSALLVAVMQLFYRVVDYSRAEKVQFEDEENYYYVKVIPKIMLVKPKREIRRIVRQSYEKE